MIRASRGADRGRLNMEMLEGVRRQVIRLMIEANNGHGA